MFAQPYLRFAEGPVFVAHQTENGQQLRLGELMFAETRPVGRQNRSRRFQGHASKGQETNLWHGTSCSSRKHHRGAPVSIENCLLCRGCQQSWFQAVFLQVLILNDLMPTRCWVQ